MKAHRIFEQMSPTLAARILAWLQAEEKAIYKAAVQGLANQRKLRPVFIERKPPAERHPWMQAALSRPVSDALAGHVVQAWLLGPQKQMLRDFLGALGIEHAEDGTVEELPPSPPKEKIAEAVGQLLAKHPAEEVAVYLHAFQGMDSAVNWAALEEILAEKSELRLGGPRPQAVDVTS